MDNLIVENQTYVKSNDMISAKYKSTLFENQIMAIALTRIEKEYNGGEVSLVAKLFPGELNRLLSHGGNIYRDLKSLSKRITGHTMLLEDGKGNFKAFAAIPNANYQDGIFEIRFNPELQPHLLGLDKGFTTLEISMMTSFLHNSTFRIYELLKKDLFRSKPSINGGRVDVEYNLFEFRFLIGIANFDNAYVQTYIANTNQIDWEELYHILEKRGNSSEIKFKEVDRLQRSCLKPAQEELEQKSDIRFEYELIRVGRPYKKIIFHIYPNTPKNKEDIENLEEKKRIVEEFNEQNRQLELMRDFPPATSQLYEEFVGHNKLIKEDIDVLLKKAQMNVDDVRKAIEYTDKQGEVANYMGYLVRCIEHRYFDHQTTVVMDGSTEMADVIMDIRTRIHSDETKKNIWESTKRKDDFNDFLEYEQKVRDLSFIELDSIMSPADAVKEYVDWKKHIAGMYD